MKLFAIPLPGLLAAAFLACAPAAVGRAAETGDNATAYAALRVLGKELGEDSLGRVVEIAGREGVPQPFVWKIVVQEKSGGGAREVEIAGGRLAVSRPANGRTSGGVPVNLRELNLDSSGAFNVADAQARRLRLSFDALNYSLRVDPATGKPVWTVQLLDAEHRDLGALSLAASDGTLLGAAGRIAAAPPANGAAPVGAVTTTTTTTTASSTDTAEEAEARAEGGFLERSGRTLDRTGRRVERTIRKTGTTIGSSIERFFKRDGDPE